MVLGDLRLKVPIEGNPCWASRRHYGKTVRGRLGAQSESRFVPGQGSYRGERCGRLDHTAFLLSQCAISAGGPARDHLVPFRKANRRFFLPSLTRRGWGRSFSVRLNPPLSPLGKGGRRRHDLSRNDYGRSSRDCAEPPSSVSMRFRNDWIRSWQSGAAHWLSNRSARYRAASTSPFVFRSMAAR